tara:strand:- start:44 stop:1573 length:1530 start_codon:yes stop_codon:yes gene_type:complete
MPTQQHVINKFTIEQEQFNNFLGPVRGALGGLPVAEQMQDYFLVYQQAGGTGPEIIDETAFFITYMVDSNGNVSKPLEGYPSQYNLIQNFGAGTNVVVRNDASTTLNSQIAGLHQVTAIGRQLPILYTQFGYAPTSYSGSIVFQGESSVGANAEGVAPYMLGSMSEPAEFVIPTFTARSASAFSTIATPLPDTSAAAFNASEGRYTINTSGVTDVQSIRFNIGARIENTSPYPGQFQMRLVKTNPSDGVEETVASVDLTIGSAEAYGAGEPVSLNTGNFPNNLSSVTVPNAGGLDNNQIYTVSINKAPNSGYLTLKSMNFSVTVQNPNPSAPIDTSFSQTPYWETGSSYPQTTLHTWLTASSYLSQNYGRTQNSLPIQELSTDDHNFSPIEVPFLPQRGDRIRFGYNKENDYFIYDVIPPQLTSDNLLKLKINNNIPLSVIRDNFLIHRTNINDPCYIILNINKNSIVTDTQNFNGVILPEYPTQKLTDNLDRITLDLKERGIITDNEI